jgi:hypothetical protein
MEEPLLDRHLGSVPFENLRTLSDRTLVETTGSRRHERVLTGDAEADDAYRAHFGIDLDRLPPPPRQPWAVP